MGTMSSKHNSHTTKHKECSIRRVSDAALDACRYMVLELNAPHRVVFFGVSRFHENKGMPIWTVLLQCNSQSCTPNAHFAIADTLTFKKGPKDGQTVVSPC